MNASIKSALINQQRACFQLQSAFFHSTPVLDRGRRNCWNSRYNNSNNYRKYRNNNFRQNVLRNASAYAEYLFQRHSEFDHNDQMSNKDSSFRRPHNESSRNRTRSQGRQTRGRRGFSFCEDDDNDFETIFRSTFGDRIFFWSFINEDYPNWRNSSRNSNGYKFYWKRRPHNGEDEYDYTTDDDTRKSDLASERTALGLSASGPLKLGDVKNAYRACALKWHPDRHQGSFKAAAEEKFKLCTAAYQSLCDRLAVN